MDLLTNLTAVRPLLRVELAVIAPNDGQQASGAQDSVATLYFLSSDWVRWFSVSTCKSKVVKTLVRLTNGQRKNV
jgi:hypothetical protein